MSGCRAAPWSPEEHHRWLGLSLAPSSLPPLACPELERRQTLKPKCRLWLSFPVIYILQFDLGTVFVRCFYLQLKPGENPGCLFGSSRALVAQELLFCSAGSGCVDLSSPLLQSLSSHNGDYCIFFLFSPLLCISFVAVEGITAIEGDVEIRIPSPSPFTAHLSLLTLNHCIIKNLIEATSPENPEIATPCLVCEVPACLSALRYRAGGHQPL